MGRALSPLTDLALEIYGDMLGHFEGHCTKAELVDWLGEHPAAIRKAAEELQRHGWVNIQDTQYTVAEGAPVRRRA